MLLEQLPLDRLEADEDARDIVERLLLEGLEEDVLQGGSGELVYVLVVLGAPHDVRDLLVGQAVEDPIAWRN